VRQVVTDLDNPPRKDEPTAHSIVPYRHIEGDKARTDPAGAVAIQLLTALPVHAGGKSRLALMIDLGPSDSAVAELTLLALFDLAEHPKLLDVVGVGTDRLTGFTDKLLPLAQGAERKSDLIVIDSDHFNSNEDFVGTELLSVRNDRFELVGALFTFDAKLCASMRKQLPAIATRPDSSRRYRQIRVAVHETVTLQSDRTGCSGEKGHAHSPEPITPSTLECPSRKIRNHVRSEAARPRERKADVGRMRMILIRPAHSKCRSNDRLQRRNLS
jgi:hypothetical protein